MAVTRECFGFDFSFGTVTDTITGLYSVYLSHMSIRKTAPQFRNRWAFTLTLKAYLHVYLQMFINGKERNIMERNGTESNGSKHRH